MRDNRALARWIAGLLVAGTVAIGAAAPAQAQTKDSGWNGTVAPSGSTSTTTRIFSDSGWNGT